MNMSFFEKHLPYFVEVNGSRVMIMNRQYELLAEGVIPHDLDIRDSFRDVASPCEDCYRESNDDFKCYLYDAKDNPFISENEFDEDFMAAYMKRFSLLHRLFVQTVF